MTNSNTEKLKECIYECKMAYNKKRKDDIEAYNKRKLEIFGILKEEFPVISCNYTSNKDGYISFFIGHKEIFLDFDYCANKPCFYFYNPFFSIFRFVSHDWTRIETKSDLGKVMTPLLEAEILGLRKAKK